MCAPVPWVSIVGTVVAVVLGFQLGLPCGVVVGVLVAAGGVLLNAWLYDRAFGRNGGKKRDE